MAQCECGAETDGWGNCLAGCDADNDWDPWDEEDESDG